MAARSQIAERFTRVHNGIEKPAAPASDVKGGGGISVGELASIAKVFAERFPDAVFPPAEIRHFLLAKKNDLGEHSMKQTLGETKQLGTQAKEKMVGANA
jgi:hypothetical protein